MPGLARNLWRYISPSGFLLFLAAWTLLSPTFVCGQISSPSSSSKQAPVAIAAPDDEDDDEATPREAFLGVSINVEPSGKATVDASFYLLDRPDLPPAEIKSALETALGCRLEDSRRTRPMPGFYSGSCFVPTQSRELQHQGHVCTVPLQNFASLHGVARPSLTIRLPEGLEVAETSPPAMRQDFSGVLQAKAAESLNRFWRTYFVFAASPQQPLPAEIVFRYGYAPSTLKRAAAILLAILLLPLVFFVWMGRKALSADVSDRAVVWFSYMRSLGWILNGTLIGWWVALEYCHAESLLSFVSSGTRFAAVASHPAIFEAVSWIPPATLWLLLYRISHPVQQKLRGLSWTKRELTLQAFYSVLAGLFPFAMFLTGLRVIVTGGIRDALFWWLGAFLLRVVAAQGLLRANGMQPQALTTGDLRDRAFALAERLRVKLQQVYLISSGKGQMVNAFARTGDTIAFTDLLLRRMSQREVDYVLAHELTHLRLKHPIKLGQLRVVSWIVAFVLLNISTFAFRLPAIAFLHNDPIARYALIFAVVSVFPYFWSRRFEYAADAGAVAATGDPRAAISALFKLSELNMMPVHWSKWREKWLTHPSSLRRARAIAKQAGIPFEEIPAIAREGGAERAAPNYAIPAAAAPGAKLHSTQRTKSMSLKLSFALIAIFALVPSLFSLAAAHSASPFKWALLAAAGPLTFAAFLLLSNYSTRLTRGDLVAALKKKLAAQGIEADSWSGVFVNFSPAAMSRRYDGNATWDIGYLFLRTDRLCYCGEETSFALRQNQIMAIHFGSGAPSFLPSKRIYIAWKDDERGACGVFNVACGNADSALHANRLTNELFARLDGWWKSSSVTRPLPPRLAELASPQIRSVTSQGIQSHWTSKKIFGELLWTAIFTAAAAALCNLPFHLNAFLINLTIPDFDPNVGIKTHFSSPGAGWFAVAVAVLVRFITMIPTLRYREKPQLVAKASTTAQAAVPPPPPPPLPPIVPPKTGSSETKPIPVS